MESNEQVEAREALESVARERAETARRYTVPRWYDELIGLAVALVVVAVALGNTMDGAVASTTALVVGLSLAAAVLVSQVARFRRLNGTSVSGLVAGWGGVVSLLAMLAELAGIVAGSIAAREGYLQLTLVIAVVTGAAIAALSRAWSRRYLAGLGA